ncbi:MAG TPA: sulfatase-like hydrolase/transferase [Candidatus Limnocylindrales bacterium]|nr:sulfatase-like hydrolase/transferase [Candidatus Limnocylindrales bacterium]
MQTPFSFMRRACILSLFLMLPALAAAAADPPNVILITLDTVRADRMGFLGSKLGLTPQLDALASEGVVFEHAYSQAPITPVSHATILTGTFPQFHGIRNFGDRLPPTVPFLPDVLHAQGYHTGAFVGSIILDPKNGFASGFERGFDVYSAGFHRQKTGERREASMQRRGEVTLGFALEWLGQQKGGPFFLWLHLWDAHDPYNPPEPFRSRFPNTPYNADIAYVDSVVGKLLDYLRAQGLYDNTFIAVAADHGESLGDHGELTHSIFLYDATIHVPLLLKLPAHRFAGQRVSATASLVDLAPTVIDALGQAPPPAMQGHSLLPLIGNPHPENRPSLATGDHSERSFGWSALVSLRLGNQLYVRAPKPELYDLASDPGAETNLYATKRASAIPLAIQLDSFVKRISEGAPQALQDNLDEKSREKLSALGYLASSTNRPVSRTDPKDRIDVANAMHDASLAIEEGKETTVIPLLLHVVAKDPQVQAAQYYLGIAYSRKGEFAKAIPPLHKAVELRPDALMAQYELAICLYETGDLKTAAAHFEILVENRPDWSDARYSMASIYARTGRPEEAAKNLLVVLQGEPDHYRANLLLGRMLFLNGTFDEALPYLEKAVKVQPDSREAHSFLADDYEKLGRAADAASQRAEAARLKPATR